MQDVRFLDKVDQTGDCWEWQGYRSPRGYGQVRRAGQSHLTHRYSYEQHVGPIPSGLQVCHRCDNPSCVNPEHLFLGTQRDNMQDMYRKGRQGTFKGGLNGKAVLTDSLAYQIYTRAKAGEGSSALAREFGVTPSTVSDIKHGRVWSHVTGKRYFRKLQKNKQRRA